MNCFKERDRDAHLAASLTLTHGQTLNVTNSIQTSSWPSILDTIKSDGTVSQAPAFINYTGTTIVGSDISINNNNWYKEIVTNANSVALLDFTRIFVETL